MHGANLMKALKQNDQKAEFRSWGGDHMQAEGGNLAMHIRDLAFMGFKEVVLNLNKIFANIKFCKQDIQTFDPDAVILIDYPGFNLRIAKFAKEKGYKVIYYISPQVWAWKSSRVNKIKRYVDQMLVILPFEQAFYNRWDYPVTFVGHPLLDVIAEFKPDPKFRENHKLPEKPLVALIPGSRKQEIAKILPELVSVIPHFPDYHFVIAGAPGISEDFYHQYLPENQTTVVFNETYNLMSYAKAGLITSGTATLEAALFELPEVVVYKGSQLSYFIARKLVNVKYISLVNLVMDELVVKELIQQDCNAKTVHDNLSQILENPEERATMQQKFKTLKDRLGQKGASERAAKAIINSVKENN